MDLVKKTLWGSKFSRNQTIIIIVALVVLAFIPGMGDAYTPLFLAWILAYSVMSLSWTFFSGKTGYISLASAAFYGLGMYIQAFLGWNSPLVFTMCLSAVAAFGAAFGVGLITLRLRGVYFAIFTFGLALFLNKIIRWYEVTYMLTKGRMVKALDNEQVFMAMLILLAIVLFGVIILNKSRFGLALDCIGQNEDSAQHIGVNTTMTKVLAFAISSAPMGAVGAAMSTTIGYVDPEIAFRLVASFFPVLMAIFGGQHYTYGPIVGAVVFFSLQDYLMREWREGIPIPGLGVNITYMVIFGIVMIIVILLMPKGLFGIIDSVLAGKRKSRGAEVKLDV